MKLVPYLIEIAVLAVALTLTAVGAAPRKQDDFTFLGYKVRVPKLVSIAAFIVALVLAIGAILEILGYEPIPQQIARLIGTQSSNGGRRESTVDIALPRTGVAAFDRALATLSPTDAQLLVDTSDRKLAYVCTRRGGNGGWLVYVRDADADRRQYGLYFQFENLLPGTAATQFMPLIDDMGSGAILFTHTRDVPNLGITPLNFKRVFVAYRHNSNVILDGASSDDLRHKMAACGRGK